MKKSLPYLFAFLALFMFNNCGGDGTEENMVPSLEIAKELLVGSWKIDNTQIQSYNEAGLLTSSKSSDANQVMEYHFTHQDLTEVYRNEGHNILRYTLEQKEGRLIISTILYLDPTTYKTQERQIETLTQDNLTVRTVQFQFAGKARVEEVLFLTRL